MKRIQFLYLESNIIAGQKQRLMMPARKFKPCTLNYETLILPSPPLGGAFWEAFFRKFLRALARLWEAEGSLGAFYLRNPTVAVLITYLRGADKVGYSYA